MEPTSKGVVAVIEVGEVAVNVGNLCGYKDGTKLHDADFDVVAIGESENFHFTSIGQCSVFLHEQLVD